MLDKKVNSKKVIFYDGKRQTLGYNFILLYLARGPIKPIDAGIITNLAQVAQKLSKNEKEAPVVCLETDVGYVACPSVLLRHILLLNLLT